MLLQTNAGKQRHLHLLARLVQQSDVAILCSGWIKLPGLKLLLPSIDSALARGARIVVYSNQSETKEGVAPALASRAGLTHHMVGAGRPLHTKIYYFEQGDAYTAVIGSANITEGGLNGNEELSVTLQGTRGDPLFHQVQQYLATLAAMKFV